MPFSDTRQCTGKAKTTGKRCKNPAIVGASTCRMHNGHAKKGFELPQAKHGKYFKHVPKSLMTFYEDSQADPDYQDLRENIKLREAFLREKLSMLEDAPDSASTWKAFRKTLSNFRKAWANENYGRANIELDELDRIVDERIVYFEVQKEIRADLAEQRKDHTAIAAIEYKGESVATASDILTFVSIVLNLVKSTVSNEIEQQTIYDAISAIINTNRHNQPDTIRIAEPVERS